MLNFQAEKALIRAYYEALDSDDADFAAVISKNVVKNYFWRGFHPFDELRSAEEVATQFWQPLRSALTAMQRRQDVFFAGQNRVDGSDGVWVVSMGHLVGLFDRSWLGIEPTGKMIFLRYCEFHLVVENRIVETAMYFDIPHFMMQAGLQPFPPQTAAHMVQPGPLTHDGLLFDAQTPVEGDKTIAVINAMVADLGQWNSGMSLEEELRRTWVEDMVWWGPAGIGATFTIERYAKQHAGPFRAGFKERGKTNHVARVAEGAYGGFFGWPNFSAIPTGGFMGMPATGKPGEFRVIDIYRRAGDKLAENWIFIDLLHFWKTQGVDILGRMQETPKT